MGVPVPMDEGDFAVAAARADKAGHLIVRPRGPETPLATGCV